MEDILHQCPTVEPPTEQARGAWRQVVSAMCRLMKQFHPPMANPAPRLPVPIPPSGLPPCPPAAHWLGAGRTGPRHGEDPGDI